MIIIKSPETDTEFKNYFHLRWRILRKPWNQPEGSERDKNDTHCYHVIAMENNIIYGVARLEFSSEKTAQLRYMAVDDSSQKKGIGRKITQHMEAYAKRHNATELFLNAREGALGFYEKMHYKITEKSYLLFDSIQHYKMNKFL